MSYVEIISLSFALAADAFAAGIGFSLTQCRSSVGKKFLTALFFALFQFFMPILGFALGDSFSLKIKRIGSPLAFMILFIIGINMVLFDDCQKEQGTSGSFMLKLIILSFATSIDALTVGTAFSFLNINILTPCITIGVITFLVCLAGVYLSHLIKDEYSNYAQRAGGAVLIFLGIKILSRYI